MQKMPTASKSKKKGAAAATLTAVEVVVAPPVEDAFDLSLKEVMASARAAREAATAAASLAASLSESDSETEPAAAPAPAPAPAPKKRAAAKKPVKVVAVVTPDGIEGSFTPEPRRPLIAHLQVKTNEVVFHDQVLRYDPNPPANSEPQPYDAADVNMFAEGQEEIPDGGTGTAVAPVAAKTEAVVAVQPPPVQEQKAMPCFTKADLMVQFKDCSETATLPSSSPIACFWCAHTFGWGPCVIPEREVNGVYNVYGNFCSPNCAVAYLLTEGVDPHVRWERMALIHRIYDREGKGRIFPAPARECLQLFGGPMSIETYRLTSMGGKVRVDVHMPPMVSILGSIDTKPIDFFDTNAKLSGGLPSASFPQRSVEEGLRLKRSKPLKDRESTLDSVMNIEIKGVKRSSLFGEEA
jgi:hypothetical protein